MRERDVCMSDTKYLEESAVQALDVHPAHFAYPTCVAYGHSDRITPAGEPAGRYLTCDASSAAREAVL